MPTIADYLKYANLQMAAEAFLKKPDTGAEYYTGSDLKEALKTGNKHASFFTETQATDFAAHWKVVDQKANTTTGFSGTLFQCIQDDPTTGAKAGELVMSFRSTEFIDDATCDNQVTNKMEIKEHGWAFGQIADMESWYKDLKVDGIPLSEKQFTVTGYSLGGHLATAFNLLHPEATATYTFNGAGVGDTTKNLNELIADFDRLRKNADGNQIQFTDSNMQSFYSSVRTRFNSGERPTDADFFQLENTPTGSPSEKLMLRQALTNLQTIYDEIARVKTLSSGSLTSPANPVDVPASKIDATRLDYQIAVLTVEQFTSSYRTDLVPSGWDAITNRNIKFKFPAFYDLYGANSPSGVANSQWHYGEPVPLFIEDQPLYRGSVVWDAAKESALYSDVKLLVQGYANNDFGDTHSLTLIVDSLNIQNTLYTLDPTLKTGDLTTLLKAASSAKTESIGGTQGKCEGDVLENVLNGLARMVRGNATSQLTGKTEGNTWWIAEDRTAFYAKLNSVLEHPVFKDLIGKVKIELPTADLGTRARTDFAGLLTLLTLSPFALKATAGNEAAVATTLQANWPAEYADWQIDAERVALERAAGHGVPDDLHYSDLFLADRAAMLTWLNLSGTQNTPDKALTATLRPGEQWYFKQNTDGTIDERLVTANSFSNPNGGLPQHHILFGANDSGDVLTGGALSDHLYGGEGSDTLDGGKDDDYLEGNAGSDNLTGGEGRDTLLGGAGDDLLEGGAGNDVLQGGEGEDTYVYNTGDGYDTIRDSDGRYKIKIDGELLTGGNARVAGGDTWKSDDGKHTFVATGDLAKGGTLVIDGVLTIENYTQDTENNGLALNEPPPSAPRTWTGSDDADVQATHVIAQDAGDTALTLNGQGGNDVLVGTDNHRLLGEAPGEWVTTALPIDDNLNGGAGNDWLSGNAGDDNLMGGIGSDLLIGGRGKDFLSGGEGNDVLLGYGDDRYYGYLGALKDDLLYTPGWMGDDTLERFLWSQIESRFTADPVQLWTDEASGRVREAYRINLGAAISGTLPAGISWIDDRETVPQRFYPTTYQFTPSLAGTSRGEIVFTDKDGKSQTWQYFMGHVDTAKVGWYKTGDGTKDGALFPTESADTALDILDGGDGNDDRLAPVGLRYCSGSTCCNVANGLGWKIAA